MQRNIENLVFDERQEEAVFRMHADGSQEDA
jgi:hypothetical protein